MAYSTLKIAVAQMAPKLGNLEANMEKVRAHLEEAKKGSAELVVFPELTMSGYTLGDEISKYALTQTHHLFQELLQLSKILPMVIGYAERSPSSRIYNAAALLDNGEIVHIHRKVYLPNYGLWEEQKRFAHGHRLDVFEYKGFRFALFICNDFWYPSMGYLAACNDADVFVVIANSALDTDGMHPRAWDMFIRMPAMIYGAYVIFANRVGTEHGWSFWGGSSVVAPAALSSIVAETGEEILHATLDYEAVERARDALPLLKDMDIDFTMRELKRANEKHLIEND
jgi:N-carbamoylputrescine amidase